jgi:hypothetical protein
MKFATPGDHQSRAMQALAIAGGDANKVLGIDPADTAESAVDAPANNDQEAFV